MKPYISRNNKFFALINGVKKQIKETPYPTTEI